MFPALVLGHTLLVLPYAVRVTAASLAAFDFAAEEAAISLGAPPLRAFFPRGAAQHPRRRDRGLRAGVHHLAQRRLRVALPHGAGHLHPADPAPGHMSSSSSTPTVAAVSVLLMALTVAVMAVVERTLGLSFLAR